MKEWTMPKVEELEVQETKTTQSDGNRSIAS